MSRNNSAVRPSMSEAVLALDMTRDSIALSARAVELRRAAIAQTVKYLRWARAKGLPVLFVCSARRRSDSWFLKFWELANEVWTPGQEPIPELFERDQDIVVHKRRYSGFFQSDLDLTLRELGVSALQLIGWSTSLAVATTAIDAWQLGYPTTVVTDLTVSHEWGGHTVAQTQQWSLDFIEAMAKSRIVASAELMA
jgi:nicotinamidase/pyrazinamidase